MHTIRLNGHIYSFAMAVAAASMPLQTQAQRPAAITPTQVQISHVENGLLPSVVIKGEPAPAMQLADRMRYYHVPGVSIAYFDHGQIEWTKAYGLADVQRAAPSLLKLSFRRGPSASLSLRWAR